MAARRGRGEATVYRDGNRWRGAVSLGYDGAGNRIRKKVSGRTKAEVLAKLRKIQQLVDAGAPIPNDKLTVGMFLDRWVAISLPGHLGDSTLDDYADTVRLHLKPALGKRTLTVLSVPELDRLWREKRDLGYSANSVRIMRTVLRTVLRKALSQAEREGLLLRNVAALSTAPRINARPGQALSIGQAQHLLAELSGHRHEALVLVMLTFGLRRGEALGLQRAELHLAAGRLGVSMGAKRVKNRDGTEGPKTHIVVQGLKTRRSRRVLFLPPPLYTLCAVTWLYWQRDGWP